MSNQLDHNNQPERRGYNRPNTRARIEARRQRRKQRGKKEQPVPELPARRPQEPAFPIGQAITQPLRPKQASKQARATPTHRRAATRPRALRRTFAQPGFGQLLKTWLRTGQLFSLVLFVGTMGTLAYLLLSPRFHIQHITIEGNQLVPAVVLVSLSGLHHAPLWFTDNETVAQKLQQNPYIEHVRVSARLPDHAIIRVTERHPDVYWQIGPVHYLVDKSGKVLEVSPTPPDAKSLVIVDTSTRILQPHDQLDPDALLLAHALSARLPTEAPAAQPAFIGWDVGLGIYIQTTGGRTVVFGKHENLDFKLAVLNHMHTENIAYTYLDLRSSNPFYHNNDQLPADQQPEEYHENQFQPAREQQYEPSFM